MTDQMTWSEMSDTPTVTGGMDSIILMVSAPRLARRLGRPGQILGVPIRATALFGPGLSR
ncbi:MAG: hypothetical protein CK429_35710 [Mycobacterium sp.]|nr:MAG: hypothetical protein CK429_35710 [Mycobacterium sp.]PJE02465.1 MAG: hypothetical protein CK428_29815 [Mycobacterium sp.]PJE23041.1 MAG: hypothetical protein CK431_13280 [Mycobacterium sp.]